MIHAEASVALVGRRLPHNENLGLGYLRAALKAQGVRVSTHYVNDAAGLARAVAAILAESPTVVGLSLADGGSALLPLALGEALRRGGYRGHVTSGGQFATLARGWLLERNGWLDSVVRFAGEVPLGLLVSRVARGQPVHGVAGVTTREGDGPPAPVLDPAPLDLVPDRDELPEILGHAAAHVLGSRGCRGRCRYCGPAALQTEERAEGVRAGHGLGVLGESGVGGVRRRAVGAVCDEIATLWHERDVRYFYFVDEHLLPYDEPGALAFLGAFGRGLRDRGVSALGLGAMLRADRLTPAIVRAFADVGLVRAFVGLELATPAEARRFGRAAPGARELAMLPAFEAAGVATVSNLMLVHPYSTFDTLRAGVDLLERVPSGVFEATRMMVYHGTRLEKTMAEEGRLVGNPLRYGYTFPDARMEGFAEIFSRLRAEAFWNYSLAYRTHDSWLALALARRVHAARLRAGVGARIADLSRRVRALYVEAYRRAIDVAATGGGFQEAGPLVARAAEGALALERELEEVERILLLASPSRGRMFAPMRSAAAGFVSFAIAASTPACGGTTSDDTASGAAGAAGEGGGAGDASFDAPPPDASCKDGALDAGQLEVEQALAKGAACFSGSVMLSPDPPAVASFSLGAYAAGFQMLACPTQNDLARAKQQEEAALAALAAACISTADPATSAWVSGGASTDAQKMADAIAKACSALVDYTTKFTIVLDAKGAVVDVTTTPAGAPLGDCVKSALAGLAFPCLAGFEVCEEFVIAE